MNILISASGYPSQTVPYAAFVKNIAEEMIRQGNNVIVIAPQSVTKSLFRKILLLPKKEIQNVGGSEIVILRPKVLTFGDGVFGKLTNVFNRVMVYLTAMKLPTPDIVYAHFWASADNILDYVIKKQLPLFVATGEDIIDFDHLVSLNRLSLLNKNTNGVICVSTKNMTESIEHNLTTRERCRVFPNAIDPQKFHIMSRTHMRKQLGCDDSDFIVAFCGRFNHRKGATRVSDAIKLLSDKNIKSIFIGGLADNYRVEPDCPGIVFKGKLMQEEIAKYLSAADIFVLPSLAEGCPNSVIEAMACGLPIISSNLPFNHDILNQSNSILIDPQNIEEISKAILLLKNDELLRNKMRDGALMTASNLTINNRVSKILSFIHEFK